MAVVKSKLEIIKDIAARTRRPQILGTNFNLIIAHKDLITMSVCTYMSCLHVELLL